LISVRIKNLAIALTL